MNVTRRQMLLAASGAGTAGLVPAIALFRQREDSAALVGAIARHDNRLARHLLLGGVVDPNAACEHAELTPLIAAIAAQNQEIARWLLRHPRVNPWKRVLGYAPLDYALQLGDATDLRSRIREANSRSHYKIGLQGLAWRAITFARLRDDYGFALAAAYLVEATGCEGESNTNLILRQADKLLSHANSSRKNLLPCDKRTASASILAFAVDSCVLSARLAYHVGQRLSAESPRFEPLAHQRAVTSTSYLSSDLLLVDDLYRLAKNNSGVDHYLSTHHHCSVYDSTGVISAKHHELSELSDIIGGDTSLTPEEWSRRFRDRLNGLQSVISNQPSQLEAVSPMGATTDPPQVSNYATASTLPICMLEATTFVVSQVLNDKGDIESARKVAALGKATADVARAIRLYRSAAHTSQGLATAELAGDLLITAVNLYILFSDQPDLAETTLQQTLYLRQQVEEVRVEMHARFDAVDRRLDQLVYQLWSSTETLGTNDWRIENAQSNLSDQLAAARTEIQRLGPRLASMSRVASEAEFWRRVRLVAQYDELAGKSIAPQELQETLAQLALEAAEGAGQTPAIGMARTLSDEELWQCLSQSDTQDLALLVHALRRFGHTGLLATHSIVDPTYWMLCAESYLTIANRFRELFFGHVPSEGLTRMVAAGELVNEAFTQLQDPKLIKKILSTYVDNSERLCRAVRESRREYERGCLYGLDLLAGLEQELPKTEHANSFHVSAASPHSKAFTRRLDPHFKAWDLQWRVALPETTIKLIPKAFLMAQLFQLGSIEIVYKDADWDSQHTARSTDCSRSFGKAAVTIEAIFRTPDNQTFAIFQRRSSVTHDYNFAIQHDAGWAHGNLDPGGGASMDPGQPQYLQWNLQRYAADLTKALDAPTTPELIPQETRRRNEQAVKSLLRAYFLKHESIFNAQLWRELTNGTKPSVRHAFEGVEGARQLIILAVRLGYSPTLQRDKRLAELLFGLDLPAGSGLLNVYRLGQDSGCELPSICRLFDDPERWTSNAAAAVQEILTADTKCAVEHPLIKNTLSRLRILQQALTDTQSKVSLSEACSRVLSAVDSLQST